MHMAGEALMAMEMIHSGDAWVRRAKVLVVDDLQFSVDVISAMLKGNGLSQITGTVDPLQGLALCHDDPPDLVLLDYNMPVMDGPTFIERMRAMLGNEAPPVLMITADNSEACRRRALETGAIDYVLKPFTAWELNVRARNLLQLHMLHRAQRDHARVLERLVEERTAELERARTEIIHRLCSAGEFRDEDTGKHIVRIGQLAGTLAELSGQSPDFCSTITHAAPLHDIGKIGVPDRVLLKPGKLDADEWVVMRNHCTMGAQILAGSGLPLLDMASEIALTHHEKWDGSGYPHGLAGEGIPLSGRIVAVCDVFDALLSSRPYKHPWPVPDVLEFLHGAAGQHLDPDLTKLFLANIDQMLEIRHNLRDLH